jgi:hypothetical protein
MSITATRTYPLFRDPSQAKNASRLASERSVPPNQIAPPPDEIGHHDAIGVPLSEGTLVEPDDAGSRRPGPAQFAPACTAAPAP